VALDLGSVSYKSLGDPVVISLQYDTSASGFSTTIVNSKLFTRAHVLAELRVFNYSPPQSPTPIVIRDYHFVYQSDADLGKPRLSQVAAATGVGLVVDFAVGGALGGGAAGAGLVGGEAVGAR
jgi:hypothetical protein